MPELVPRYAFKLGERGLGYYRDVSLGPAYYDQPLGQRGGGGGGGLWGGGDPRGAASGGYEDEDPVSPLDDGDPASPRRMMLNPDGTPKP